MPFDFELVPRTSAGVFDARALGEMRAWWDRFPILITQDDCICVFRDEETRALGAKWRSLHPTKNDYLTSYLHLDARCVRLSVVGETVTDQWIYDFALYCQQRWACELQYFGKPVPATDLLSES